VVVLIAGFVHQQLNDFPTYTSIPDEANDPWQFLYFFIGTWYRSQYIIAWPDDAIQISGVKPKTDDPGSECRS